MRVIVEQQLVRVSDIGAIQPQWLDGDLHQRDNRRNCREVPGGERLEQRCDDINVTWDRFEVVAEGNRIDADDAGRRNDGRQSRHASRSRRTYSWGSTPAQTSA